MLINRLFNIIISFLIVSQLNGLPLPTVSIAYYAINVFSLFLLRTQYLTQNHTKIVSTNFRKKPQLFCILANLVEGDMVFPVSSLTPNNVSLLKFNFLMETLHFFKQFQAWSAPSWYFSRVAKWNRTISILTRIRYEYFDKSSG